MKVSCDVIRDLLPVYHDDICSPDSRALVEEHLTGCETCREELAAIELEISIPHPTPDEEAMNGLSKAWKRVKQKSLAKGILAATLVLALIVVGFFAAFTFRKTEGNSMSPTIEHGEICIVNKATYTISEPQRGDILCAVLPQFNNFRDIVRLVAVPGDEILFENGTLYINGEGCYFFMGEYIDPVDTVHITLGEDEYFVIGDNHNNSLDSRDDRYGLLSSKNIVGKVIATWNPATILNPYVESVEAVAEETE